MRTLECTHPCFCVWRTSLTDLTPSWPLVPIRSSEKVPRDRGWLERAYTPADFSADDNVGVKLGHAPTHLVDVDCDCPEAVHAARQLLPHTRTHGRAGRPWSHYWFCCPGLAPQTFQDVDGTMIVEIRSTGQQTLVPPSTHPSGEPLRWESEVAPLVMDGTALVAAVQWVAIAALFARHWPSGGGRHAAAGHVGGALARLGLEAAIIERIVRSAAQSAQDDEVEDRARFARESAERQARGEKTTGVPRLREAFAQGDAMVARLLAWMGKTESNEIASLNDLHFVAPLGRQMVVGTETPDGTDFQTFEEFEKRYYNRFVGKRKLGRVWLEAPERRTYERVVFAPPAAKIAVRDGDYNLWRGFAVEPDPGPTPEERCPRFLEHVQEVIADGHNTHAKYVLEYMADIVQKPGRLIGKALAIRGPQGLGKSLFGEAFGHLFGRHGIFVSSREHLLGRFNSQIGSKVFCFADEALWGGGRQDIGILKSLTTQDTIRVERKGIDVTVEKNYLHFIFATNEEWVWPAGNKERRGVILDVTRPKSASYYAALAAEIESKTFLPALLAFLQALSVDEGFLRRGLDTQALRDQQHYTADAIQQWWCQTLEDGAIEPLRGPEWPAFVPLDTLYQRYCEDMGTPRQAGSTYRASKSYVTQRIHGFLPGGAAIKTRSVEVNVALWGRPEYRRLPRRGFVLPSLAECRKVYDRMTGTAHEWPPLDNQPVLEENPSHEPF